jgi:hypothetical protein
MSDITMEQVVGKKRRRVVWSLLPACGFVLAACQGNTPDIGVHNTCGVALEFSVQDFDGGSFAWESVAPGGRRYVGTLPEGFVELFVSIRTSQDGPTTVDKVARSSLLSVQPVSGKKYADLEYAPSSDACDRATKT